MDFFCDQSPVGQCIVCLMYTNEDQFYPSVKVIDRVHCVQERQSRGEGLGAKAPTSKSKCVIYIAHLCKKKPGTCSLSSKKRRKMFVIFHYYILLVMYDSTDVRTALRFFLVSVIVISFLFRLSIACLLSLPQQSVSWFFILYIFSSIQTFFFVFF